MVKLDKVYLRKKGKKTIFEKKVDGKSKYIWTIPEPYNTFLDDLSNSSFFTLAKSDKIKTLLRPSTKRSPKETKGSSELPTTEIIRTPKKDALTDTEIDEMTSDDDLEEDLNELVERAGELE